MKKFAFLLIMIFTYNMAEASHVMGGELTWSCGAGGVYTFELVFYRDCNGAEVNVISETVRVWNHPSITQITLDFVSRADISPSCTEVTGSPPMLDCGIGSAGGNGSGAIEQVVYRRDLILPGTPPSQGWIFTYENFSRSNALTNIENPSSYGITIAATMYPSPNTAINECTDSSPQFLQSPYFVTCTGSEYRYNMNAVDPDLDSMQFEFGIPYDHFPTGNYDPPNNPIPVPFESDFSFSSPTPGVINDPNNIEATINSATGELIFTSFTSGNYNIKILVKSYREGMLISKVEREMQVVVLPCSSTNEAPEITAPFGAGSFETDIVAGDLISFDLIANDFDLLQDGSNQNVIITPSGPMFGSNFTSDLGCDIEPCATLNNTPPIEAAQTAITAFSWQTTCDHLINQFGAAADVIPYDFVFKVQDNFCQVPKVTYATVRINVHNSGILNAPKIKCIQTDDSDNITIFWNSISDPGGSFVEYGVYSVQDGLIASIPDITVDNYTVNSITSANEYYLAVQSGVCGNTKRYSDTVSNIYLSINNPGNGTALLSWNNPSANYFPEYNTYTHIYREYPSGTLTLIDSVEYSVNNYKDTIDICQAFIKYQIILPTSECAFTSNKVGDDFEDMLTPDMPTILSVGIDTLTNEMLIQWNQNNQNDTYGYVIYTFDSNGILYELDTIWGISNISYSYNVNLNGGPYSYSVAAFDSCSTNTVPVTFQTSAKASINTSMISSSDVYMCDQEADIYWTPYIGRPVDFYEIWSLVNGNWNLEEISQDTNVRIPVTGNQNYTIYINAVFFDGYSAFSNPTSFFVPTPGQPAFHYFKLATVNNDNVELYDFIDESVGITEVIFQRRNLSGAFEEIGRSDANSNVVYFLDEESNPNYQSWEYRTKYIDSCGTEGTFANTNKTIFLEGSAEDYDLINTLSWSSYEDFDGGILEYHIYRAINGIYDPSPIVILDQTELSYIDDVNGLGSEGKICYRIEAVEAFNTYNFSEISSSNELCLTYSPKIYIPNAFTPNGVNPIFKPIVSNINFSSYHLSIINRWGQLVFESFDKDEGWNGLIQANGKKATNDVYVYIFEAEDENGIVMIRKGFVSLIE
jgi:gliding motility-associated-like protein